MAGDYKTLRTTGLRGINQNEYVHLPDELLSATNVWAPNGVVENRPGYWPTQTLGLFNLSSSSAEGYFYHANHGTNPPTIVRVDQNANVVPETNSGDNWYLTFTTPTISNGRYIHLIQLPAVTTLPRAGDLYPVFYFSDGTSWRPCYGEYWTAAESLSAGDVVSGKSPMLGVTASDDTFYFNIKVPENISSTFPTTFTTPSNTYAIRVAFIKQQSGANSIPSFTLSGTARPDNYSLVAESQTRYVRIVSLDKLSFGSASLVLASRESSNASGSNFYSQLYQNLNGGRTFLSTLTVPSYTSSKNPEFCSSITTVPATGEVFVAYNGEVVYSNYTALTNDVSAGSGIESRVEFVGPGAPYSTDYIAQRTAIPEANHIEYWNSRLWAADENAVYWSAPFPYHKVWPLLSVEPISVGAEKIRAIRGYQQHVAVFTESKIFRVNPSGEDNFGTLTVSIDAVVSGVGSRSPKSIVELGGRLVFLGEDSLYAYDGTPNIRDLTLVTVNTGKDVVSVRRLEEFFQSINPSMMSRACAINWKSKHCYLLAVATGGSIVNNKVLCWDYKNDTFWLWDMTVCSWMIEDDAGPEESLFFGSNDKNIYKMTGWQDYTKNFAVEIMTHKLGASRSEKKMFRKVCVEGAPSIRSLTVAGYQNGETQTANFSGTLAFNDTLESDWPADNGVDKWIEDIVREKKLGVRVTAQSMNIKLTGSASSSNLPFRMGSIEVDYMPLGRR
jgi:hypothetical protein